VVEGQAASGFDRGGRGADHRGEEVAPGRRPDQGGHGSGDGVAPVVVAGRVAGGLGGDAQRPGQLGQGAAGGGDRPGGEGRRCGADLGGVVGRGVVGDQRQLTGAAVGGQELGQRGRLGAGGGGQPDHDQLVEGLGVDAGDPDRHRHSGGDRVGIGGQPVELRANRGAIARARLVGGIGGRAEAGPHRRGGRREHRLLGAATDDVPAIGQRPHPGGRRPGRQGRDVRRLGRGGRARREGAGQPGGATGASRGYQGLPGGGHRVAVGRGVAGLPPRDRQGPLVGGGRVVIVGRDVELVGEDPHPQLELGRRADLEPAGLEPDRQEDRRGGAVGQGRRGGRRGRRGDLVGGDRVIGRTHHQGTSSSR
jgi:hypothetical protein